MLDSFTEINSESDMELALGGALGDSLSFGAVQSEVTDKMAPEVTRNNGGGGASASVKVSTNTKFITATMSIERYYSSVKEEVSPLAADALTLLDAQDYVGFFKACGPNYVRTIRRAQEVTAIFEYESTSSDLSAEFSKDLQGSAGADGGAPTNQVAGKAKFASLNSSLKIKIIGFGMGLTLEGSESMVATTLEEFNGVMKFAFNSMTRAEGARHIGMVKGMEVVPWVNNLAFNAAAKIGDENVLVPVSRDLIPSAVTISGVLTCLNPNHVLDKFSKCCEQSHLYDAATLLYDGTTCTATAPSTCICRPFKNLDKSLVRDNMSNNGEFVARLDNVMRYKMAALASAEKCISASRAVPTSHWYNYIKQNDSVPNRQEAEVKITLIQLRRAMDPNDDYGLIKQLAREFDEWIEKFYSPCLGALYGDGNEGLATDDNNQFMAASWYTHEKCMYLTCLMPNMRWDRTVAGCSPGIFMSPAATIFDGDENTLVHCAKKEDDTCKYPNSVSKDWFDKATGCWTAGKDSISGIEWLMNNFCNPTVLNEKLEDNTALKATHETAGGTCVPA